MRSSDSKAVQLPVWAKEARRKDEEEWMFLKQKSSEKKSQEDFDICAIKFGAI